jgi:hypothetical protein
MVIVITGTSRPLFRQSDSRLQRDLEIQTRPDRKWLRLSNPRFQDSTRRTISDTLADWSDPRIPEPQKQTVLITVMKNHQHLTKLIQLLSSIDLRHVPVLVIDDEADQAGLNTQVRQGGQSTTYRQLLALRNCLPRHAFLQYTATPQAPLLINLIDALSPRFAEVLTPGPEYTGGRAMFVERPGLVRTIPTQEIPSQNNPLNGPPESLLEAMRLFFLGVAAGWILSEGRGNRSMLVHPSQLRTGHHQYYVWVMQVKENWAQTLSLDAHDPDREQLLRDFRDAYDDLRNTVDELPAFDVLAGSLLRAVRRTAVEEVNSSAGTTPSIDWSSLFSHILVGGQAMDRGFTVEGLTVTYMPRGTGVGNADTIQQRARFYGYKRAYLGYCRIYLEGGIHHAFRHYVDHEADIRERLIEHQASGQPLSEWKRAFFLNQSLRPTRQEVLQLDYMQGTISDTWYTPDAPHDSEEAVQSNREVVARFLGTLHFNDDDGDPRRTEPQKHKVASAVSLRRAYEDLLLRLRVTRPKDSQKFTGMLLQIGAYLEANPDAACTIYNMSAGRPRVRALVNDEVQQLFQGANYDNLPGGARVIVYPGDREIRASQRLTIQFHNLTLRGNGNEFADVPAIAVWVPSEMAADWLVQDT